jgi:hypothetical protein
MRRPARSAEPERPAGVLYFNRAREDGPKGLRRQVRIETLIQTYDIRIRYIMEYFYISIFQIVRAKSYCSYLIVVRYPLPVRLISGRGLAVIGVEEMPGHSACLAAVQREHGGTGDFVR